MLLFGFENFRIQIECEKLENQNNFGGQKIEKKFKRIKHFI